jgi:hypothetical protein
VLQQELMTGDLIGDVTFLKLKMHPPPESYYRQLDNFTLPFLPTPSSRN